MSAGLDSGISRRRFLISTSIAATVGVLAPPDLYAQDDGLVQTARRTAAAATISVQKLRGNVSVLIGAGGNIAVLSGRDGKLLIDAGFAGARPKIADALASISSDPIKHLINTHWHFDHTDGNEWLHSAGAVILAHANTRKHLSNTTRVEGWNFTFPPAPLGAIPAEVFEDERTVQLNGTTIVLKHYAPAHTDSDISVHFREADILHVADTFWNGYYPFIDYSTGGSIDGMIRATETNLAKVTDKMIVIPGHGAMGDKSQLTFYRDLLVGTREKVAALKTQGKSLTKLSPQSLPPQQTQSGVTALGALKTSSETFSRAFDADCERVTETAGCGSSGRSVQRNSSHRILPADRFSNGDAAQWLDESRMHWRTVSRCRCSKPQSGPRSRGTAYGTMTSLPRGDGKWTPRQQLHRGALSVTILLQNGPRLHGFAQAWP